MKTITFFAVSGLLVASVSSVTHAQTASAKDCSEAQATFISTMGVFRSAFFEREDADSSAESVMAGQVLPSAEKMYQLCPAQTIAAVKEVINRSNAKLSDPNRAQLVQCDKALVTYTESLIKFDNRNLSGGYNAYRILLDQSVSPFAQAAIGACPQMPELAKQTRLEIAKRQTRLNRLEDIENAGSTMADDIAASNARQREAYESSN